MDGAAKVFFPLAIASSIAVAICIVTGNLLAAVCITFIPLLIITMGLAFINRIYAFLLLFTISYFISVLWHYVYMDSLGVILDAAIGFNMLVIVTSFLTDKPHIRNLSVDLLIIIGIWTLYCTAEIFNPRMLEPKAWMSSIRSMALYFLLITILVQLTVKDFHQARTILALWSVLVLISFAKVLYQKYVGWTVGDRYFLYALDGKRTHLIYYGTRYFSIFTDAANFGGSMGMALVVFLAVGIHTKNKRKKLYYWFVAAAACYGMFVSGTRSALAVPIAGVFVYLALVRDMKKMIPTAILAAIGLFLLGFTDIGNSNSTIRRARTAFHREEDPSYIGRKENQAKLREIMEDMPMGNSLGMSGGRAHKYGDFSPLTEIPTDSWFVQLWVETGIIGQLIYFFMMGFIFIKGAIIIFFRLKKPEIRGICAGMLAGVAGLFVMSSNNEVFTQLPNSVIVYTLIAIVFMSEKLEKIEDDLDNNGKLQRV